jgi:hypothetical protein
MNVRGGRRGYVGGEILWEGYGDDRMAVLSSEVGSGIVGSVSSMVICNRVSLERRYCAILMQKRNRSVAIYMGCIYDCTARQHAKQ